MKIYLATWFEDENGKYLTEKGCKSRLLSYYALIAKKIKIPKLRNYHKTGLLK